MEAKKLKSPVAGPDSQVKLSEVVTLSEACGFLTVTKGAVRAAVRDGRIKQIRLGDQVSVYPIESLVQYKATRRYGPGRPKEKKL